MVSVEQQLKVLRFIKDNPGEEPNFIDLGFDDKSKYFECLVKMENDSLIKGSLLEKNGRENSIKNHNFIASISSSYLTRSGENFLSDMNEF